jgi:hypothetical protein
MEVNWDVVRSLAPAVCGLTGVWLGGHLSYRRDAMRERDRIQKETIYLATLVVAHLERLINCCIDVAFDDGTVEGRPAGDGILHHAATVPFPEFDPLTLDVDWKALPAKLMHKVLSIPYRIQQIGRLLSDPGYNDPPDHVEYFWERQRRFAALGLEVCGIVEELAAHAGIPLIREEGCGRTTNDTLQEQLTRITKEKSFSLDRLNSNNVLPA